MAGRSSRENRGSHLLERRKLRRANRGLGRYLEAEVEWPVRLQVVAGPRNDEIR